MILEKFLGNSLKKVTKVGESGEILHFCYLGGKRLEGYRKKGWKGYREKVGGI